MREKRPWPAGEVSPWANEEDRPGVLEVARAYPDMAIGNVLGAAILAIIGTGFLAWGLNHIAIAVVGWIPFATVTPVLMLWPFVTALLWWLMMKGEIRGWWTTGGD